MEDFTTNGVECSAPETIIVIGAGHGDQLASYLCEGTRRVYLVDPDPECGQSLRAHAKTDDRLTIIPVAVAGNTQKSSYGVMHFWNNAAFNGLRQGDGLLNYFPGIRKVSTATVEVLGVKDLFQRVELADGRSNTLVLEAMGENLEIIRQLIALSLLDSFNQVALSVSQEKLFDTDESAETCLMLVQSAGFELRQHKHLGFGVSRYVFERRSLIDQFQDANQKLQAADAELSEIAARLTSSERARKKSESRLKVASSERDIARAEIERMRNVGARTTANKSVGSENKLLQDKVASLQVKLSEMEARAKTAEDSCVHRDARLAELTARQPKISTQVDSLKQEAREAKERLKSEETARVEGLKRLTQVETDLEQKSAELTAATSKINQMTELLREREASSDVAKEDTKNSDQLEIEALQTKLDQKELEHGVLLRSQAALHSDFTKLQEKYEALYLDKKNQDTLLMTVTARLTAASGYLHQLNGSGESEVPPALKTSVVPGEDSKPQGDAKP
ncbi:hypothetical protein [uncultured Shimia sp.]|uniref:hypothetical protein n=1 Tax=uncultured Shimia sp. TaxID=573152 RepID=UPI002638A1FC|nr:hypothetical protein [uncultured Shimia sp.]